MAWQASAVGVHSPFYYPVAITNHGMDLCWQPTWLASYLVVEPLCLDIWTNRCLGCRRQLLEAGRLPLQSHTAVVRDVEGLQPCIEKYATRLCVPPASN